MYCVRGFYANFWIRVGGIVSEHNFKFFVQFVSYTAIYCLMIVVVMAIYVHEKTISPVC